MTVDQMAVDLGEKTPPSIQDGSDLEKQRTQEDSPHHPHHPISLTQSHIEKPKSLIREIAFVATLAMSQLLTQAGLGVTLAPLHIIGNSFGVQDPGQLSWYIAAYSLTVGTFILIAGRLGDVYGHKKFFVVGFLWFGLWSLLAGFSVYSSSIFFVCCRALQGLGPAFVLPNAIAILGRTYPPGHKQGMIFSAFGATAPSGYVIGAVFSSIFAEFAWWPWAFWVLGIACVFLAVAGTFIIPPSPPPVFEDKSISMLSRVDAAGSFTGVTALVLFNFAWNQAPIVGWETVYTYVILIIGVAMMVLFAVIESRAAFPLVPFEVMNSKTGFVLGCIAAGWSSFGIWLYYTTQLLQQLRHSSPLSTTAQFAPVCISGLVAAITTGLMLQRFPPSFVMMISMMAFATGIILIATAPVEQTYWAQTFVATLIMPFGMDMSFPAATIIMSNAMPHEHQGLAASLVNTVLNYSVSIGLGFAGTIEVHINKDGTKILEGYRAALYMGIGLACLGIFTSTMFVLSTTRKSSKAKTLERVDL